MNRRFFIRSSGVALASFGLMNVTPSFLQRAALAQAQDRITGGRRNRFVGGYVTWYASSGRVIVNGYWKASVHSVTAAQMPSEPLHARAVRGDQRREDRGDHE